MSLEVYSLAANFSRKLPGPVLPELNPEGGEYRRLSLKEEHDLREPLVGQILQLRSLKLAGDDIRAFSGRSNATLDIKKSRTAG